MVADTLLKWPFEKFLFASMTHRGCWCETTSDKSSLRLGLGDTSSHHTQTATGPAEKAGWAVVERADGACSACLTGDKIVVFNRGGGGEASKGKCGDEADETHFVVVFLSAEDFGCKA